MLNELENVELEMIDEIAGQESEGWKIDNDVAADWAIEKIKAIKQEYKRKEMIAQNKIKQIQDWLQKQKEGADQSIMFFEDRLCSYFNSLPKEALKKTKTTEQYKLSSGTLKLKYKGPEIVRDDEKLLTWVKQNKPRFVKVKESVDWAGLKELTKIENNKVIDVQTGEVIDGVEVQERNPEFIVEVD